MIASKPSSLHRILTVFTLVSYYRLMSRACIMYMYKVILLVNSASIKTLLPNGLLELGWNHVSMRFFVEKNILI